MDVSAKVQAYLAANKPYTLWTWIKYNVRSQKPSYCEAVKKAMQKALDKLVADHQVERCKSFKGRKAYRTRNDPDKDVPF